MRRLTILSCLLMLTMALAGPSTALVHPPAPTAAWSQDAASVGAADTPHQDEQAPRRGTSQEMRDYEQRESRSPEVQEFAGGILDFIAVVLLVVLIILIVD